MSEPLKILYVDDESLLKMAFVETLNQHGYNAVGAESGAEAIGLVGKQIPDILILDIMMTPMDGWETLTNMKTLPGFDNVAVIMQTGKSLTLREVIKYGEMIDDYLIKPVRLTQLINSITVIEDRREMIKAEISEGTKNGSDPELLFEYGELRRKVLVKERLMEVLGRLYPVRQDKKIGSNFDLPGLKEVIENFSDEKDRLNDLRESLFGMSIQSLIIPYNS